MATGSQVLAVLPSGLVSLAIRWLMLSFAVWVAAELIPGIHLEGLGSTLAVAAILGLLNLYLRPILFMLSLPVTIVTFGLFVIVVNAILLGLTDWLANIFDGVRFDVDGVGSALLGSVVISIVSLLIGSFIKPERIAQRVGGR
ncbi:MAG: phage holin family protein [Dehalococcoidia bacterium]|nr:phage holin family protein [Dehalococcoidia bacterium]